MAILSTPKPENSTPPPPPPQMSPSATTAPLQVLLDLINSSLAALLASSLAVRSFVGRWQALRAKLADLSAALADTSESPHWAENPLLHTLLPNLLSTLSRLSALSRHCADASFSGGKLLMQSDLDIASSALAAHLRDLDLLLRSGVLHHSNAIVLSHPGPHSAKDDLAFFVRDLFTRLQIGGVEFKKKALESLLQVLAEDEKSAGVVAREGNIGYLIHLLDFNNQPSVRELAASAVSALAASSASDEARRSVFEEGALGPLLRILETGSTATKEKAAIAVEAITADPENAWAVTAYGGVSVLIEACRSGSPAAQAHAAAAIRNVADVEDVKAVLGEEGAVPVLLQLLVSGVSAAAQEKAASCIAALAASGEYFRALIVQERGLQRLMHLMHDISSSHTLEHVLRAIVALSSSDQIARILSSSTVFVVQLGELVRRGNLVLQQLSASLIGFLSISDGNKRAIGGCMASLVRLMEAPKPAGLQDTAAQALVSLLAVRSNRKELVRDEKSVMRIVQMLDPMNEAVSAKAKALPVALVAAILGGGSHGCRKRLLAAGAQQHLQRLAEMDVAGAKKAVQRLAGNRLKTIFMSRTWRE